MLGSSSSRHPRLRHQTARHRQHLLLAAGQRARNLPDAFAQHREHGEHVLLALPNLLLVGAQEGAHSQVLPHRQASEDAPALGNLHDATSDHVVGRDVGEHLTLEAHLALGRGQDAADCVERGGLARAVGANQGDNLVGVDLQGESPQRVDVPVEDMQVVDVEHRHVTLPPRRPGAGRRRCRGRPR